MHRISAHSKHLTGVIACAMAYVLAVQVTLAVSLNAWLPPSFAFAFGEICHEQIDRDSGLADRTDTEAPATVSAAHCPLCVTPAFALLMPPDAPAGTLRRFLGIAYEPIAPHRIAIAEVDAAHRARAPPLRT